VADYRAMNRNSKFVDVRKKLATKFSTPAPKFTPGGRPGVVSTPNPVAGAGTNFLDQMGKRYTINTVKGIKDVVEGTISNNSKGFQNNALVDQPAWLGLLPGVGQLATAGNYGLGNLINNEAASDAAAPFDFVGAGGPLKGAASVAAKVVKPVVPVLTSKAGKFATAASAAIAASGFANSDAAQAGVPVKPLLKAGNILSDISVSSLLKKATNAGGAIDAQARSKVQGVLQPFGKNPRLALMRADDAVTQAKQVGASLEDTVKSKLKTVQDDIYNFDIYDPATKLSTKLGDHMFDADLAPFKTYEDVVFENPSMGIHSPGRPTVVSDQNISDSVNFMKQAAGDVADASRFVVKTGRNMVDTPHGTNLWENDHLIPTSFARHLISTSAEKLLKGKGAKLTQSWHDDSQALLDFVNDPENIRRVNGWWNQVKSNNSFDTAAKDFYKQFPEAAKSHLNPDYLAYGNDMGSVFGKALAQTTHHTNLNLSRLMDSVKGYKG